MQHQISATSASRKAKQQALSWRREQFNLTEPPLKSVLCRRANLAYKSPDAAIAVALSSLSAFVCCQFPSALDLELLASLPSSASSWFENHTHTYIQHMLFSHFLEWCILLVVGCFGALPIIYLDNGTNRTQLANQLADWSNSMIGHVSLLHDKGPELVVVSLESMLLTFFGKDQETQVQLLQGCI